MDKEAAQLRFERAKPRSARRPVGARVCAHFDMAYGTFSLPACAAVFFGGATLTVVGAPGAARLFARL